MIKRLLFPSLDDIPLHPEQVRAAQIESFARQTPINAVVTLAAISLMAALTWKYVPTAWIIIWVAYQSGLTIVLLFRWFPYRKGPWPDQVSPRAVRRAALWATMSAAAWGSTAAFMPMLPLVQQMAVIIILNGMAAGAATTLAAVPVAAAMFVSVSVVPIVIYLLYLGDPTAFGLALLALTFVFAMLGSSRIVYRAFLRELTTKQDNLSLVSRFEANRREWLEISDTTDAFALFDQHGKLLLWNSNYGRLLSLPREALYRGAPQEDLFHKAAKPAEVQQDGIAAETWIREQLDPHEGAGRDIEQRLDNGIWVRTKVRQTGSGGKAIVHMDITALKLAEEALRRNQSSLAKAQQIAHVGNWSWDLTTNETYWSDEFCRIHGLDPDETDQTFDNLIETIHPDDCERITDVFRNSVRTKLPYNEEFRVVDSKGNERTVRALTEWEVDPDGNANRVNGITQDITGQRRTERALDRTRAHLEEAIEGISEAIVLYDPDDRIVLYNSAFAGFYPEISDILAPGLSFEDMLRATFERGAIGKIEGDPKDFLNRRLERHQRASGESFVRQLPDGPYLRVSETRTRDGGVVAIGADITELVEREEALRKSQVELRWREEYFRSLIENASDMIVVVSAENRVRFQSPSVKSSLGYGPKDFEGKNLFDFVHPEDRARAEEELARVLNTAQDTTRLEFRIRHEDGTWRDIQAIGRNALDVPSVKGVVVNARDITDRLRAEIELEQTRNHLSNAIEAISEVIVLYDAEDRIVLFNSAVRELYAGIANIFVHGARYEDLIRTAVAEGYFEEAKDDPEAYISQRIATHRRGDGSTAIHRSKDGRYIRVAEWLTGNGGIVSVGTDITDIVVREEALKASEEKFRRSEEYFRALINNTSDLITLLSVDGTIQFESPSITNLLGYAPEELIGVNVFDLIHPADVTRAKQRLWRTARTNGENRAVEFRVRSKDGDWRTLASIGSNALDNPSIRGIIVNSRDITELKEQEGLLRQAQKMESVGQLTGGVAHDFNNLLAVAMGNLQLLEEKVVDNQQAQKFIQRALRATQRGAALTHRLLAFSRKQPLRPQPTDLNQLVTGMEEMLERTLGGAIEVKTTLAPDLHETEVDPNQLENVLLNLALNARDAMPDGGTLYFETRNRTLDTEYTATQPGLEPGEYVGLTVGDTGSGMSKAIAERVFEPFFTTKNVGEGSGLGLSMVYGFIKQSGGDITVCSEPGHGTRIQLCFPRSAAAALSPQNDASDNEAPRGRGETILVVEDDEAVRETAIGLLEDLGYMPIAAPDAASGLEILDNTSNISLLFTDIVLPGGTSGVTLAENARLRHSKVKTLFTSGYTDKAVAANRLLADGEVIVEKPYRKETLARRVRSALDDK